jgi:hypothetical protein
MASYLVDATIQSEVLSMFHFLLLPFSLAKYAGIL